MNKNISLEINKYTEYKINMYINCWLVVTALSAYKVASSPLFYVYSIVPL